MGRAWDYLRADKETEMELLRRGVQLEEINPPAMIVWIRGAGIEPCVVCGRVATALCDYPVGRRKTCDQPLCEKHRIRQGAEWQDIDFCPTHALIAGGNVRQPVPVQAKFDI